MRNFVRSPRSTYSNTGAELGDISVPENWRRASENLKRLFFDFKVYQNFTKIYKTLFKHRKDIGSFSRASIKNIPLRNFETPYQMKGKIDFFRVAISEIPSKTFEDIFFGNRKLFHAYFDHG